VGYRKYPASVPTELPFVWVKATVNNIDQVTHGVEAPDQLGQAIQLRCSWSGPA